MISVIGLGVAAEAQLLPAALKALQGSTTIIGSSRQLASVAHLLSAEQQQCQLPALSELLRLLNTLEGQAVAVLASGDPLFYGIGRWLRQHFSLEQLNFYPAVSSIQVACHALGLSLQDVKVVSLHGRPLATLRRHIARHRYLAILTDQYSHPHALAELCVELGLSDALLSVCERLGYPDEKIRQFVASELVADTTLSFADLHVTLIEIVQTFKLSVMPAAPGIADDKFFTDAAEGRGLLTKREVRMAVLGLLRPVPESIAWDIGAGCGGVAVEWALLHESSRIYAIEQHDKRLAALAANREHFGVVNNLEIIAGTAPQALEALPDPQRIFIGGSDGALAELLELCWRRLTPGGYLVVSAVTEGTKAQCFQFADNLPDDAVETLQLAVSKGGRLAGQWVYRPKLPVSLFCFVKQG